MLDSLLDPNNNGAAGNTQYISGTLSSAQTGVDSSISGDPVASAITSTAVPTGTVALLGIGVSVSAGGNVNVRAKSQVSYTGIVGGLAAGEVGIGGSVEIANIEGNTQAYIDANSTVSAGGNVAVDAELVSDTSNGTAFAGTAGIAAIGAQVVDIQDSSTESATLNSGVTIPQAQQVQVTASSNRSLTAQAVGGDVGGVVAGVGVAIANATGGPSASIGSGAQIGQTFFNVGGVTVAATSTDTLMAKSYGVAAGGLAATGVYADAQSAPNVTAAIDDNAAITSTGAVNVTAANTPRVDAQAFGVAVGAVSVGAAVSVANVAGTTSSDLGNNVWVSAPTLVISAERTPDAGNDPTAQASATAGSGGVLFGANATVSTATSGGFVQAATGTGVMLPDGNVTIEATNSSDQSANATGVAVGGLLAIGADVATATSNVTTLAQLGAGAITNVTGTLDVSATGKDENDVSSTAGSGGAIAGDASVGNTNDTSTVSAVVVGSLLAGTVNVGATNNSIFTPDVSSVNAALAGASGAVANNNDNTAANATVLSNTVIMASFAVDITAQNTFTENVPTNGNTVSAGAGGFLNGTAALSTTTLTGNATVTIGSSVMIDVETPTTPSTGTPGIFLIASSALNTNDQVTLSTGGALAAAGTDSSLTATLNNNVVTDSSAADPDVFTTNQNIGIGTYTTVNAANNSEAHTWGVLGAVASSSAETVVTSNQSVALGPDTDLTAYQNINLYAGDDPTPGADTPTTMVGDSNAQSYVRGLVAVPSANATTTLTSDSTLTVGTDDQIYSGGNTTLAADHGTPSATAQGIGHGYEVGLIPATNGSSSPSTSTSSTVTVNGTVTAGIFDQLDITIPSNDPTTPIFSEPDSPIPVASPSYSFDPSFNPSAVINSSGLSPTDQQVLDTEVSSGTVAAMELGSTAFPLTAYGGNVTVDAGSLLGDGTITAYGAPTINITNPTADYLVLGPISIPQGPAGNVVYTGTATLFPGTVNQMNGPPVVNIQETYDQSVGSNTSAGPAVFLTGEVDNLRGQVTINDTYGSVVQLATINANQVDISAPNGALVVYIPTGTEVTGSSPYPAFDSSMIWPGGDPATVVNLSPDDAVAYVANAEFNTNGSFGTDPTDMPDNLAFTASLIGSVGQTPPQSFIGPDGAYDEPNTPQLYPGYDPEVREAGTSLVFYGSNTGDNTSITATAASESPVGEYYQMGDITGRGLFPVVPVEPLTTTATAYPTITGSSGINAGTVLITAGIIDVDSTINVGLPNNWSLDLPSSLNSTIALYQLVWNANPTGQSLFTLPVSTVTAGDQQITAQYDAVTGQIIVNNVNASSGAGFLSLDGAIMSTNTSGDIVVNDGNGQVTIDNETNTPVVVNNVNAGSGSLNSTPPSEVDIIDTKMPSSTQQTLYVYNPGGGN